MCGRFTTTLPTAQLLEAFGVGESLHEAPVSFNMAPGRDTPVIYHENGRNILSVFRWGLVPSWAKDPAIGNRLINARAETVAEKPSFRSAFRKRRCLILADGFYEWKREGGKKTPYYISVKGRSVFAFAGLWESWATPEGGDLRTCAIITTHANSFMAPIHHRMPVILPKEAEPGWLDPAEINPARLQRFLQPCPSEWLRAHSVSTNVNSPRHDSPELILPLENND